MTFYPKIQTVYMRDPATKHRTLLEGQWSIPEFGYLARNEWIWTEKVDGTNVRVEFDVCHLEVAFKGRTDDAQFPTFLLEKLRQMFDPQSLDAVFNGRKTREEEQARKDGEFPEIVLYGEGYGAKIQKGGGNYIPDGCSFILFDVRVGGWWLRRDAVLEVASNLGISVVPELGRGTLLDAIEYTRKGFPSVVAAGRCEAEGLVMRPAVELFARNGDRIIAKIKNKDFVR